MFQVIRSLASATPIEVEDTGQVVSKTCNGRIPISSLQKPRDLHSKVTFVSENSFFATVRRTNMFQTYLLFYQKPLHRIKVIEVSGPEVTEMADNSKIAQELNGGVTSSTTTVTESVSDRIEKKSKHDIIKTEDSMPNLPDPPLSSYQFQKDYRRLRNHQDLLYRYLKVGTCWVSCRT